MVSLPETDYFVETHQTGIVDDVEVDTIVQRSMFKLMSLFKPGKLCHAFITLQWALTRTFTVQQY